MLNSTFTVIARELVGWQAFMDILLIAAGLFFLYRTLLRLGTWRIVAGVLVALLVFFIANRLELKGLEWIFGNFSQVAAIALIVIFQPELRKILERSVSVRRAKFRDKNVELSSTIVDSLLKLAEQQRGALVVIPGKESLREWLSGGQMLDAKPSPALIMSIFDPNSPGHDGAVIFEEGKLTQFGVRLPVSQTAKLSEEYGTRHYAAMGLAEKTDALVIALSEERGKISIFHKGKRRSMNNREKLIETIVLHWKEAASYAIGLPEGRKRTVAFAQVLISLVLALFVWSMLIATQSKILERVITLPVSYTGSPPNLILVGDRQKEVRIHLAGPKSDLDSLNVSQLSISIDLSNTVAGKQTFLITRDNIQLPKHINLLEIVPSSLELMLLEIVEQEAIIKPQLVGKLPVGIKIESIEVIPEKVKVFSPITERKGKVIDLITTPIYLESIYHNTKIYCKIIAPPTIQPTDKRWPDVEVEIKVGP